AKFEQAQQALRQRDLAAALKLIDEADQADPNQASTINLRGEILAQQEQFDQAEAAFKKAAKLDPKLREAQYNLAQIPFKKKEYAKARDRFETLYKRTPGGDKNQAADWTASANKIYSSALNSVFADAFYDVGWMQRPAAATMPTPAFDTAQAEGSPAVEPSPIPDKVFAANSQNDTSKGEGLALGSTASASGAGLDIAGTGTAARTSISASNESASGTGSQPQQPASASSSGGSESTAAASSAASPQPSAGSTEQNDQAALAQTSVSPSPAAEAMPVKAAPSGILARG